jgi:hypothetical protein
MDDRDAGKQLARAVATYVREVVDIDTRRKVERAIDNQGHVILDGRDFIPLKDENGAVWRIRVNSAGVISATQEA